MNVIFAVMNTTWAVVKVKLEKSSVLYVEVSIPAFWQLAAIQMSEYIYFLPSRTAQTLQYFVKRTI